MMLNNIVWGNYTELGNAAYQTGNLDLAETMFAAALEEARQLEPEDPLLAASFNNLALVYQKQGQLPKAALLFKLVLALCDRAVGAGRRHLAGTLDKLAELCFEQGDMVKARALYHKVLKVFEQIYGPHHLELVPRLKRLGHIYCRRGRYAQALSFYNRAQTLSEINFVA